MTLLTFLVVTKLVFMSCVGQYVFHPAELTKPVKEKIDSVLGLESVELSIGGSNLIGAC